MNESGEPTGDNQEERFLTTEDILAQTKRTESAYPLEDLPYPPLDSRTLDQTTPEKFIAHYGINGKRAPKLNEPIKEVLTNFYRMFCEKKSVKPLEEMIDQYEATPNKDIGQELALRVLKDYVWYLSLHLEPDFRSPGEPALDPVPFPEVSSEIVFTDISEETEPEPEQIQEEVPPVEEILENVSTGEVAQAEAVVEDMDWKPDNEAQHDIALAAVISLKSVFEDSEAPAHGRRAFRHPELPPEKKLDQPSHRGKPKRDWRPPVN